MTILVILGSKSVILGSKRVKKGCFWVKKGCFWIILGGSGVPGGVRGSFWGRFGIKKHRHLGEKKGGSGVPSGSGGSEGHFGVILHILNQYRGFGSIFRVSGGLASQKMAKNTIFP